MFRCAARSAALLPIVLFAACSKIELPQKAPKSTSYADLTALFADWRSFQRPKLVDGVPDYTAGAMDRQRHDLEGYQRRLYAIDPAGWPIPQQVDWHVVRAEMNGLDFDQNVLLEVAGAVFV